MMLTSSTVRRGLAVVATAIVLVFVFAKRMRDPNEESVIDASGGPRLGIAMAFEATAYCKGETTASGVGVRAGVAAADPVLLPLGSVVRLDAPVDALSGIWTVLDTGPEIKGREIDLYVWSCHEALEFGRQPVRVTILRLGWDPRHSAPTIIERLFRRRESVRPIVPPATPGTTPPPTPP